MKKNNDNTVKNNKAVEKKAVEKKTAEKKTSKRKSDSRNIRDEKKSNWKDWILIIVSILALLVLIFIVYSTKTYDSEVSKMLISDSKKENLTTVTTTDSKDNVSINEVSGDKWIELFNSGNDEVDLTGTAIYVSGEKVADIAAGTKIAKGSVLVVELPENPAKDNDSIVSLVDSEGNTINSIVVPKLVATQSYGLTRNDNNDIGFMTATRGEINPTELAVESFAYYDGIGFSAPGGFYDSSFALTLTAKEGEKIYYTTDATEPTKESAEYTEPIVVSSKSGSKYVYARMGFGYLNGSGFVPRTVDAGMVVRAITVDARGRITGSATQEYFIGLANDSAYANIPVISLTVNPDDMFGYFDGIYVLGRTREDAAISGVKDAGGYANYLNGWSRDSKITYYEPSKDRTFEQEAKVEICVNTDIKGGQKALTFTVSDYDKWQGSSLLKYINDEGKITLNTYEDDNTFRARDMIANKLMEGSKVGTRDLSPCILFIDGEYWGVYLMTAPFEADYFKEHFNVTGEVIVRQNSEYQREFLSMYNFVTRNDMSISSNYEQAKEMVDIDNYIEYVCANVYMGNSNFRTTTGVQWRTKATVGLGYNDGRWRWIMNYPIGNSMGKSGTQTPSTDTFLQGSLALDRFYQSLLMNKEFCRKLEAKVKEMSTGIFAYEKCEAAADEVEALMEKPSIDTQARFSGSMSDKQYSAGIEAIKSFFASRGQYITIYAAEVAKKGGDLAYIDEMEAQNKGASQEIMEGEIPEGEEAEGENAEGELPEGEEGANAGEEGAGAQNGMVEGGEGNNG